jgi:phosphoglycolate phosphatase-like HAD superfamily hydrolase
MLVVFDLDGTLCDNSAREHLAKKAAGAPPGPEKSAAWDQFHAGIPLDTMIWPIAVTLSAFYLMGHQIELWTARPEKYRTDTDRWMLTRDLPYHELLMRPEGDWRHAYELKMEWAAERKPQLVFEDHPETVKRMRAAGIVVAQVGDQIDR